MLNTKLVMSTHTGLASSYLRADQWPPTAKNTREHMQYLITQLGSSTGSKWLWMDGQFVNTGRRKWRTRKHRTWNCVYEIARHATSSEAANVWG